MRQSAASTRTGNPVPCPPDGGGGSSGSGPLQPCNGAPGYDGCISDPSLPPVTIIQPPLTSIGGFSSGSWYGNNPPSGYTAQPLPSALYHYGIIDASAGPCSPGICPPNGIKLCGGAETFALSFPGGATTLLHAGLPINAFWFITSLAYAHDVCSLNTDSVSWGTQQADWFAFAINSLPVDVRVDVSSLFIDLESANGDPGEWQIDKADNVPVINAFFGRLCSSYSYCSAGVYAGADDFVSITGTPAPSALGASQVWMASFGPTKAELEQEEKTFTDAGYQIYSWQYTDDNCELPYDTAASDSDQAMPAIPKFDKWTNSTPDVVCP